MHCSAGQKSKRASTGYEGGPQAACRAVRELVWNSGCSRRTLPPSHQPCDHVDARLSSLGLSLVMLASQSAFPVGLLLSGEITRR